MYSQNVYKYFFQHLKKYKCVVFIHNLVLIDSSSLYMLHQILDCDINIIIFLMTNCDLKFYNLLSFFQMTNYFLAIAHDRQYIDYISTIIIWVFTKANK